MADGTFKDWLAARVGDGDGQVSRRELARRLAERTPGDSKPENFRSSIIRILNGKRVATDETRRSIGAALGDGSWPTEDEETSGQAITREMVVSELDRLAFNLRRLKRALTEGTI